MLIEQPCLVIEPGMAVLLISLKDDVCFQKILLNNCKFLASFSIVLIVLYPMLYCYSEGFEQFLTSKKETDMKADLQKKCDLMVDNQEIVKQVFRWEGQPIHILCGSIYTTRGLTADQEKLAYCKEYLKKNTGVFSSFRGAAEAAIITLLAVSEDPKERMSQMLTVFDLLKVYIGKSEYLAIAATIIAEMVQPQEYAKVCERVGVLYKLMKEQHSFLTSKGDSATVALLALSDLSNEQIETNLETCYELLKPEFFSKDAVWSLSQVLTLGGDSPEKAVQSTMGIFNSLKEMGYKYGTSEELPAIGVLSMLGRDEQSLAGEISEADEYLKKQKGFGNMRLGRKQRLMYAGMLVADEYLAAEKALGATAMTSAVALVIAQQLAMVAAISAVAAGAAASSSSSS